MNFKAHSKLRSYMRWGVKTKQTKFINGQMILVSEEKKMVPVKYLEHDHLKNILNYMKSNPGDWNGYHSDMWILVLSDELKYRNMKADQILKLFKNSEISRLFTEHTELTA